MNRQLRSSIPSGLLFVGSFNCFPIPYWKLCTSRCSNYWFNWQVNRPAFIDPSTITFYVYLSLLRSTVWQQDILCNGKQVHDCGAIHIYDRSTSSRNDAKVLLNCYHLNYNISSNSTTDRPLWVGPNRFFQLVTSCSQAPLFYSSRGSKIVNINQIHLWKKPRCALLIVCHWFKFSRQATSRSLCLVDEFGKGTLTEGTPLSALHKMHV